MKYYFIKSIIIGLSTFFLYKLVENQIYLYEWKSVSGTFTYQFYQLRNYQKLSLTIEDNELFFYEYAQRLTALKEWKEADSILNKVINRRVTSKLLLLRGDIQLHLNDTINAIKNYKLACFIVPHSLTSKLKLMKTNLEVGDTLEGYFWANNIVRERVKIRSPTSDSIQKEALNFLTIKIK